MHTNRFTIWTALTLVLLTPGVAAQGVSVGPEQLRVTIGEQPKTLVVQWAVLAQPYTNADNPVVTWQNGSVPARLVGTIRNGNPSIRSTGYYETFVYGATIGPLDPDTTITYRVGSAQRGMSTPRTVQAPPAQDGTLRFVAYGDIGLDSTAADGSKNPARPDHPAHDVRDLAIAQKPDLFLIPGDLPYNNARDGWDAFMRFNEPLQSTVPTMPVIGNHEWDGTLGYAQFLNSYVLPGDEQSYQFTAGAATFIGVNTDVICSKTARGGGGTPPRPCDPDNAESVNKDLLGWVEAALANASADATPWTIVYHHHPAYSWGNHGSDWAVQTLLGPLYGRYGVDLVVTAHDHMYTRSHPVINNQALRNGTDYPQGVAPIYVVAGGGGRSLYDLRPGPWPEWVAHAEKIHHLARVDVSHDRLDFVALRSDGSEMDRFSILPAAPVTIDTAPGVGALIVLATLIAGLLLRKTRCS